MSHTHTHTHTHTQAELLENRDAWEDAWARFKKDVDGRLASHDAAASHRLSAAPFQTHRHQHPQHNHAAPQHHAASESGAIQFYFDNSDDEDEDASMGGSPPQQQQQHHHHHHAQQHAAAAAVAPPRAPRGPRVSVHAGVTANGTPLPDDMRRLWKEQRLDGLTVERLRAYLRIQNLPVGGAKPALLERAVLKLREEEDLLVALGRVPPSCAAEAAARDAAVNHSANPFGAGHMDIEVPCEAAAHAAMPPMDVPDMAHAMFHPQVKIARKKNASGAAGVTRIRRVGHVLGDSDSDDEAAAAPVVAAAGHQISATALKDVPSVADSPTAKAERWTQEVPRHAPRGSTANRTEIGSITGSAVMTAIPPSPYFFDDGLVAKEPTPEMQQQQYNAVLSRLQEDLSDAGASSLLC